MSDAPPKTFGEWAESVINGPMPAHHRTFAEATWHASRTALKAEVLAILIAMDKSGFDYDPHTVFAAYARIEKL